MKRCLVISARSDLCRALSLKEERMKFTKMHGCGNDYVYVDCSREAVENPSAVATYVSDRHFGIGSDGLILIKPSQRADFEMEMYNADGSLGQMCGNGIRCVGKYVYDHGLTDKTKISIDTASGIKILSLNVSGGRVISARVDMGIPELDVRKIPVTYPNETFIQRPIEVKGRIYHATCVSMGNPHCVIVLDEDVDGLDLEAIGPDFEHHSIFPKGVNTEFINWIDRGHLKMRVWERGSGETLACGTGACAAAVAAIKTDLCDLDVEIALLGGKLQISYANHPDSHVFMTGPAEEVFSGEIEIPMDGHRDNTRIYSKKIR